jgi:hypothetical protein
MRKVSQADRRAASTFALGPALASKKPTSGYSLSHGFNAAPGSRHDAAHVHTAWSSSSRRPKRKSSQSATLPIRGFSNFDPRSANLDTELGFVSGATKRPRRDMDAGTCASHRRVVCLFSLLPLEASF